MEEISLHVLNRRLPRHGICEILVADECFIKGNIAKVKTSVVISEKDLPNALKDAEYDFVTMRDLNTVSNIYYP